MKYLPIILRFLYGVPMVLAGVSKFVPMEQPPFEEGSKAAIYMTAFGATYLVTLVGVTEIIGGLLMFFKKTSALGAIILAPVLVNILGYNLTVDPSLTGIIMSLIFTILAIAVFYFEKERLLPIINNK